jgi:hypothetical protein
MPVQVTATPLASQQITHLRRSERESFDRFLQGLKSQGCRHLGYRLTGEIVERLCVKHLSRNLRVIVAFESKLEATVLLVGPHTEDPLIDVYTRLYELAGLKDIPKEPRNKPPCCTQETPVPPTIDEDLLDSLVKGAERLRGSADRRTARGRGRR